MPSPSLAVPNLTAHPSTASVPTSYYSMWHFKWLRNAQNLYPLNVLFYFIHNLQLVFKQVSLYSSIDRARVLSPCLSSLHGEVIQSKRSSGACPTAHRSTFLSHCSGPVSCWTRSGYRPGPFLIDLMPIHMSCRSRDVPGSVYNDVVWLYKSNLRIERYL